MKNKRIILIALLISLMVLGAAFAEWAASFDVTPTIDTATFGISLTAGLEDETSSHVTVSTPIVSGEGLGQAVSVTVGNLYPTAYAQFSVVAQNDSSIPVSFIGDAGPMEIDIDADGEGLVHPDGTPDCTVTLISGGLDLDEWAGVYFIDELVYRVDMLETASDGTYGTEDITVDVQIIYTQVITP